MPLSVARAFAESVAARDTVRLKALISHRIDFVGLTPDGTWEATDRDTVVDILVNQWRSDDERTALSRVDIDVVADRQRVGYRMAVDGQNGHGLVEHQAYLTVLRDKVTWMRLLSSGFRPLDSADPDAETT